MNEEEKSNFHQFALQSVLFKGRPDLYFCYLKAEKIAHACGQLLFRNSFSEGNSLSETLIRSSSYLPSSIVRFAARELEEENVLVDLFELLSLVRLSVSNKLIEEQNAAIIIEEYEGIARKISLGKNASPFLSLEDFAVPPLGQIEERRNKSLSAGVPRQVIKDNKGQIIKDITKGQNQQRSQTILKIILQRKRVSIKDISGVVKDCSEKTIQRELNFLIHQGFVRKEGERRWSVYMPANSAFS